MIDSSKAIALQEQICGSTLPQSHIESYKSHIPLTPVPFDISAILLIELRQEGLEGKISYNPHVLPITSLWVVVCGSVLHFYAR